jgi:hypothetical protein
MLSKINSQKKIDKICSYLEEHYPYLYNSVGGRRVKKILHDVVFKKRAYRRNNNQHVGLS